MIQREEVERLAADVERNAIYDTGTKAGITAYGYRMIATMLRDLEAERDAAQERLREMRDTARTFQIERDAAVQREAIARGWGDEAQKAMAQAIFDRNEMEAERDAAQAALRTAAGLANEMTWKASTRPFADRLANIIRDGFTARAALTGGPTP